MLCEKCKQHEATHQITQSINGTETKMNLCDNCAKEIGFDNIFQQFNYGFSDFVNSFFGNNALNNPSLKKGFGKACSVCGHTFSDITATGRMGCGACYDAFQEELLPAIEKIHGKSRHIGRVPSSADAMLKEKHELVGLKQELQQAIQTQAFEKAAQLRDKINALQQKPDGGAQK